MTPDVERHWNYRVIEFVTFAGEPWRSIHEVHYENDKPVAYSEGPAHITWDTDEGDDAPRRILDMMRAALDKPILVERDFQSHRSKT